MLHFPGRGPVPRTLAFRTRELRRMPRTARSPKPLGGTPLAMDAVLGFGCAALALWVQRGALAVYFHPDDLISLERARGLLATPDLGAWRLLSGRLFFTASLAVFGTDPRPYHVVNAVLHATNVVLLYALARRWGAPAIAAALAAGCFGAARPAFSVLQQAVGIGELLSCGLATTALLLCEGCWRLARGAAVLPMVAALLSKEGVLFLPLVLLVPREPGAWARPAAWRERLGVAGPLLAVSAVIGGALALAHVRERAFAGVAYAIGFGADLFHNLMTYTAWAFDVRDPFYDQPGAVSRQAWRVALPIVAALIALAWATRNRSRLPAAGLTWAGLTIAPVLPLLHHTYANYLYVPLAGLALALGAGLEALVTSRPASRAARAEFEHAVPRTATSRRTLVVATIAAVLLAAHAANSNRLLADRLARRYQGLDLPLDPQLMKSEMVRRAAEGLRRSSPSTPRRIVLYLPNESSRRIDLGSGTVLRDTTLRLDQMVMYQVLDGGRALRALFPGLDSVAFVSRWTADHAGFDLCANTPEGDIVDLGQGPDAHLRLGGLLLHGGFIALAVDDLTRACEFYPHDPRLRQALAAARAGQAPR